MARTIGRTAVALAAVAGLLAVAAPAGAHVTVNPRQAEPGSFARLDFRVPNESDTESTVALEVVFPEDAPIPGVSVGPVPGWESDVTLRELDQPIEGGHGEQITEVVESVTWTATGEAAWIGPGQFAEFPVSAGPMPEGVDELHFRALQTYSDDTVVRWIELPEDGAEPDFPAPGLRLAAADDPDPSEPMDEPAGGSDPAAADDSDGAPAAVAWAGLAGAVLALLLGAAALVVALNRSSRSGGAAT